MSPLVLPPSPQRSAGRRPAASLRRRAADTLGRARRSTASANALLSERAHREAYARAS
jgi:hypothetical protein